MRAVIYTHDMEPITVIELNGWPEEFLKRNRNIRLPIQLPFRLTDLSNSIVPSIMDFPVVEITSEIFVRNGERHLMLFTNNEESALLLKSVFLPGQRDSLNRAEREAFGRGIAVAMGLAR